MSIDSNGNSLQIGNVFGLGVFSETIFSTTLYEYPPAWAEVCKGSSIQWSKITNDRPNTIKRCK